MNLTSLETQVLEMFLRGDDDSLAILRDQADRLTVRSREMTGVGFFTEFLVSPQLPAVNGRPTFRLDDVIGTAENVKEGLGFVLYVTDGSLSALEGYTYDEPWPDEVRGLKLTYRKGQGRDLDEVRRIMHKT